MGDSEDRLREEAKPQTIDNTGWIHIESTAEGHVREALEKLESIDDIIAIAEAFAERGIAAPETVIRLAQKLKAIQYILNGGLE